MLSATHASKTRFLWVLSQLQVRVGEVDDTPGFEEKRTCRTKRAHGRVVFHPYSVRVFGQSHALERER